MSWSIIGGCHGDEKEDGHSNLSFGGFVPGDGSCCFQIIGAASWEVGNMLTPHFVQIGYCDNEVLVHTYRKHV